MITSTTEIRVRYAETDKMAIAYHTNYFTWFEVARIEMLDNLGYAYKDLEERGYLLPVLEIQAKYMRPARFDDRVNIHLKMTDVPLVKWKIHYEVKRGETLLAKGYSVHAFMSPEGQAVRPPEDIVALVKSYFEA